VILSLGEYKRLPTIVADRDYFEDCGVYKYIDAEIIKFINCRLIYTNITKFISL